MVGVSLDGASGMVRGVVGVVESSGQMGGVASTGGSRGIKGLDQRR